MKNVYFLLLSIVLGHVQSLAQSDIVITDTNLGKSFTNKVLILEDAEHSLSPEDLAKMQADSFMMLNNETPAVQFTTSCYWLKFSLKNESSSTTFFLETARPVTDQIYFYQFEDGEIVEEMVNGDNFNYHDKNVKHRKNIFPIEIAKGEKKDIVLAVLSGGEGIVLSLIVHEKTAFFEQDYLDQFKNGFYFGLMSIIIVIYFFFYLLLKDVTFLYYILYVFFQGLLQFSLDGYSHQHFFTNNAYMIDRLPIITGGLTIIFMLIYVVHFLKINTDSKRLYRLFKFSGGLIIISLIFAFFRGNLHHLSFPMVNAFSLLCVILSVTTIFYLKAKGIKIDNYFTFAFVVLIFGAIIFILGNFNLIKDSRISLNALKISSMFEVIILSISMSYKYRTLQKDKEEAQATALKNLAEKNAIMDESNVKLEHQVIARTSEIEEQRAELSFKNKEILSSIQYAKRIQEAILPSDKQVNALLKDAFIFYLPKDLVSGDFYFVDEKQDGSVVFAAVDCTGHGVPGAFMSIVGNNFLNQSITENNLNSPASILGFLNVGLSKTLKYDSLGDTIRDGMDMALCTLNNKRTQLEYSGAKNPLYIITPQPIRDKLKPFLKEENEAFGLVEIKGDKHPIGNYSDAELQSFVNHKIDVEKGDTVYIFTDGFADQFGGSRTKKYNYKRFRALLLDSTLLPMQEQKKVLEDSFYLWKGKEEQIDDVLVMGIKI